jgi:L-rhamnose 1-dehydrogenase
MVSVYIKNPEVRQIRTQSTLSHYTPTKAGILSLMQSCAVALGKYNIRCNSILPGTIATDINKEDLSDLKKREYMERRTVLGRLGG